MPKYSSEKREYTVGDYWLGQRSGSPAWYRMWYDERSRRTKRASLNTTDFEEAKELLNDWFFANRKPVQEAPEEAMLAEILARYYDQHARHIASHKRAKEAIRYWLEFYGEATLSHLKKIEHQEEFHAWLLNKGMKPTSVRRIITVGKAGINRAWKRGEIEHPPFILTIGAEESRSAPPKGRPLDIEEIAELFNHFNKENIKIFTIFMIATGARPEAIYELTLDRCDTTHRIITLNPEGRAQNSKYRPTLRMPESIVPLVTSLQKTHQHIVESDDGSSMMSLRRAWNLARDKSGLEGKVTPYSLRHTMARWLRAQGVPAWEVSAQLGHKRRDMAITEVYAPHDPSYLKNSCDAIDYFFAELRAKCAPVDLLLNA